MSEPGIGAVGEPELRVALDVSAVPARPAGAGVYVIELARALATSGAVDLTLLSGRGDVDRWRTAAPSAALRPTVPPGRPLRLAWEQVWAPAAARRARAHVWHGPHYTMPMRSTVPAVVTIHDMTFFDHPEWHERTKVGFFRRMIMASARRAAVLVCVSEHTSRRLHDVVSPPGPVVVAPHGVDHDRFRPEAAGGPDDDLARLRAAGVRPPYLVFVGTLEPRKNVPALVRAFDRVASAHGDLTLVLAGQPGWGADEIDAAVAACRHGDRVLRLGYVPAPTVPALLRHAAAAVYPAFEEGFGLPALEALACGAPLVTTSGSAMEEVTAGAAVLVPPGDEPALTDALAAVAGDAALRTRLRAAGPPIAAPYTWERCASLHVDAYRRAAAT